METRILTRAALVLAGVVALCGLGRAEQANVPTLSVAKTEASRIAEWQPAMGEGLAQMLITELTHLKTFRVLESVALDDLRKERELGERGEVSEGDSVKKGQWLGADYTFKSTVTRFGSKQNRFGGGGLLPRVPFGGDVVIANSKAEVQIDWRIVDNASREVVASGRGVGVETGRGFSLSAWGRDAGGHAFSNDQEFLDSALGKATMKALAEIVANVGTIRLGPGARTRNAATENSAKAAALRNVKGIVKLVEGREVWVTLGSKNGFAVNDKVKIYRPVVKTNRKGEAVATMYEPAGEIVLKKVQAEKSVGIASGTANISEDWVAAAAEVDVDAIPE